jgi:hypothetical protein
MKRRMADESNKLPDAISAKEKRMPELRAVPLRNADDIAGLPVVWCCTLNESSISSEHNKSSTLLARLCCLSLLRLKRYRQTRAEEIAWLSEEAALAERLLLACWVLLPIFVRLAVQVREKESCR